jgi:DNA processing protein
MHDYIFDIALTYASGLTAGDRIKLYAKFGKASPVLNLSVQDIRYILNRNWKGNGFSRDTLLSRAEKAVAWMSHFNIRCIRYDQDDFPTGLLHIPDRPCLLFYRGNLSYYHERSMAMVGTRKPDQPGIVRTRIFAETLARDGFTIISGLARGIDTIAHTSCINGGGQTIAVLGCGIDTIYPRSNRDLARSIVQHGGAVLTEYPPGSPPQRWRFPYRNRIIVGMTQALLVTQSPGRSGSMISATLAQDYGRDLYVVDPVVDSRKEVPLVDQGNILLINSGAISVRSPADIHFDRM